jgi:hypothetical protein
MQEFGKFVKTKRESLIWHFAFTHPIENVPPQAMLNVHQIQGRTGFFGYSNKQ